MLLGAMEYVGGLIESDASAVRMSIDVRPNAGGRERHYYMFMVVTIRAERCQQATVSPYEIAL